MSLQPGDHLGPYEIVGFVGAGGMGEVYRARDPRLNRDVAVKVPFAAHHIHQLRYYLTDIGDPAAVGLTVVNGQMYFAGFETRSNVWMAERRDGTP